MSVVKQPYYTEQRWKKMTDDDKRRWCASFINMPEYRAPSYWIMSSKDDTLFSLGKYKTNLTKYDLPSSFVHARFFKLFGYWDASKVQDFVYRPNMWINHLLRDDMLHISFKEDAPINIDTWANVDITLDGWDVVEALCAMRVFSSIDKSRLDDFESALLEKVRVYAEMHPDEHDVMSVEEMNDIIVRTVHDFKTYVRK